ncbi:hypothetical protein [Paraburkholderia bryophila]|uniref:Uncharacterized protein n=1 Tax=Paraburkholderia bryophila TaxID=420952 RepID=A0A7Z0BA73_9BURK|nr:hypothetical protein [Paraburkholderia bryophila]NYH26043.1 hypothetical protein [Paraburkholderia bryophila]
MDNPLNLDLRARAELLAYLVASHLLARQMTGDWLSSDHVVESTAIWLRKNGGGADVLQRVMLSTRALEVAQHLEGISVAEVTPQVVRTLFCENLRLDFRSPTAREIYNLCLTLLLSTRWFE